MRIDSETLEAMRGAIAPLDTAERRARYIAGDFPRAELVRDLDRRYRWDLFYAGEGRRIMTSGRFGDSHIDTALRRIVRPLTSDRG